MFGRISFPSFASTLEDMTNPKTLPRIYDESRFLTHFELARCSAYLRTPGIRAAGEARDRGYAHLTDVRAKALAQSCLSPFKTGHVRFSARTAPQSGLFQTFSSGIAKPAKAPKSASKAKVGQMMAPAKEKKDCFVPSLWPR